MEHAHLAGDAVEVFRSMEDRAELLVDERQGAAQFEAWLKKLNATSILSFLERKSMDERIEIADNLSEFWAEERMRRLKGIKKQKAQYGFELDGEFVDIDEGAEEAGLAKFGKIDLLERKLVLLNDIVIAEVKQMRSKTPAK